MKNLRSSFNWFLILFSFVATSKAQELRLQMMPHDKNKKIQIILSEREIVAKPNGFHLKLTIRNRTDTTFILYSFKVFENGEFGEELYKRPGTAPGSELFPVDKKGNWNKLEMDGEIQQLRRSDTAFWRKKINILYENSVILRGGETQAFDFSIGLHGALRSGVYNLHMIYNSGFNVINGIDEKIIMKDEKDCRGMLYQGYVESNSVSLIFK